jgi:hypothetical protein
MFTSSDSYPQYKTLTYDIIREYKGVVDTVLRSIDSSFIGVNKYSPPFDGLTLNAVNDTSIVLVDSLTGWLVGNSNLSVIVTPDNTSRGMLWPADYEIRFYDSPQDTSFINSPPYYSKFPINIKIWNNTEGRFTKLAVRDNDQSGSLTIGDLIQVLEFTGTPPTLGNSRVVWNITYDPPLNPNNTPTEPVDGDKFLITTKKQFKTGDYFTFSTKPVTIDNNLAKEELSLIGVVPNPYLGAASWERRNLNSSGRGERKIDFINLPAKCTIRIYTVAGALIKTLNKDSAFSDGSISWDLVTEDGMDAAYGLYIYHVNAPEIGEHIGKFALIK